MVKMLEIGRVLVVAVRVMIDGYVHLSSAGLSSTITGLFNTAPRIHVACVSYTARYDAHRGYEHRHATPSGVEYLRIGRVRDSPSITHNPLPTLPMFLDWLLCCFKPCVPIDRVDVELATPVTDRNPNPMPPSAPAHPSNSHRPNESVLSSASVVEQRPSGRRTPEMSMAPGQRVVASSTNIGSSQSKQVPQGSVRRAGRIPMVERGDDTNPLPLQPLMAVASGNAQRQPLRTTNVDPQDSSSVRSQKETSSSSQPTYSISLLGRASAEVGSITTSMSTSTESPVVQGATMMEPKNGVGRLADMYSDDTRQGHVDTDSPGPTKPETEEVAISEDVNGDMKTRLNGRAVQDTLGSQPTQERGRALCGVRGTGAQDPSSPAPPSARAESGERATVTPRSRTPGQDEEVVLLNRISSVQAEISQIRTASGVVDGEGSITSPEVIQRIASMESILAQMQTQFRQLNQHLGRDVEPPPYATSA